MVAPRDHLLLVSEDEGNAAALSRAGYNLRAGGHVTWICSTATSTELVELESVYALKNTHMSALNLLVITREEGQPFDVLTGTLDRAKLEHCAEHLFAPEEVTATAVAGSLQRTQELSRLVAEAIPEIAVASITQLNSGPRAGERSEQTVAAGNSVAVTVIMQGRQLKFTMDRHAGTLLDGADDAGVDLPFSCRGGVCSTCRAKLRLGEVDLIENYALEEWEIDSGFTLPCQAEPLSAEITLDYDEI